MTIATAARTGATTALFAIGAAVLGAGLTALVAALDAPPPVIIAIAVVPLLAAAALQTPWLAIGYVFASIPIGDMGLPGIGIQLVQAVVVGVAGVVILGRLAAGHVPIEWSAPLWWFLGFVGWAFVAMPSAADPSVGIRQVLLFAGELVFAAIVLSACRSMPDVRRVLGAFLIVAVGVAVSTGGPGNVKSQFGGSLVEGRAEGVFNQPNELGTFAAVALLSAVGMALGGATPRSRRAGAAVVAVCAVPLLLSLSRGAWIGASAGLLMLAVSLPEARRVLLAIGLPGAALALAIGSFAPQQPEVQIVSERARSIVGERNPYDDRPNIWAEGRRQTLDDPWTGQGPGSFPIVAARSGSETVTFHPIHAHNLPLTFAAEMGVPAVALFAGMVVASAALTRRALRRARTEGRNRDAAVLAALAAALVAVLAQGLIDYSLRSAVILTEIVGVLGLLLAAAHARTEER